MEKAPAFQFYVKDWLADLNVRIMTPEEKGAYIELMAIEWNEIGLPNDDQTLAHLSGLGEKWSNGSGEKIKKCFIRRGKKLIHPRLEKERKKQHKRRIECSLAGQASGTARKNKGKEPTPVERPLSNGSTTVQPKGNTASASSTASSFSSSIALEIISHLNQVVGSKYRPKSEKTKTLIKARLSEGFTVQDFKTVIDKKFAEWGSEEKWSRFLRPETLFGTKFEGYLNQSVVEQRGTDKTKGNYAILDDFDDTHALPEGGKV